MSSKEMHQARCAEELKGIYISTLAKGHGVVSREVMGERAAAEILEAGFRKQHPDAEAALFRVESIHHIHGDQCLCGFKSSVSRDRTKHIMEATIAALNEGEPR